MTVFPIPSGQRKRKNHHLGQHWSETNEGVHLLAPNGKYLKVIFLPLFARQLEFELLKSVAIIRGNTVMDDLSSKPSLYRRTESSCGIYIQLYSFIYYAVYTCPAKSQARNWTGFFPECERPSVLLGSGYDHSSMSMPVVRSGFLMASLGRDLSRRSNVVFPLSPLPMKKSLMVR